MQASIFAAIRHITSSILLSTSIILFTRWNKIQKDERFNNNFSTGMLKTTMFFQQEKSYIPYTLISFLLMCPEQPLDFYGSQTFRKREEIML